MNKCATHQIYGYVWRHPLESDRLLLPLSSSLPPVLLEQSPLPPARPRAASAPAAAPQAPSAVVAAVVAVAAAEVPVAELHLLLPRPQRPVKQLPDEVKAGVLSVLHVVLRLPTSAVLAHLPERFKRRKRSLFSGEILFAPWTQGTMRGGRKAWYTRCRRPGRGWEEEG